MPKHEGGNCTVVFVLVSNIRCTGPLARHALRKKWALTKCEQVKLLFAGTPCCIDREENRPGNAAANEAYNNAYFQVAEEKIAVQRVVLQDVGVRNLDSVFSKSTVRAEISSHTLLIAGIQPNRVLGSFGDFSWSRREPRYERGAY